ncbi:UNVERIFIED_CONTAM: hypothetical protein HDU68_005915 [Siphonaria sp. JEL0065]|nr:hypothetical protein HDU68_005915 [Siphonaria sp. JEL0065]
MLTSTPKTRSPPASPPPELAESAVTAPSVPDATVVTGDILATALVIAELGPSLIGGGVGSILKAAVSTVQESFTKQTQLRLLRLHHLYDRHFHGFKPSSNAIKQLISATTAKDGTSPDSLLRLVSRDEWLDRCESKSALKSTAAEILQVLFDANLKADPGTVTSSCIHTIALHLVDMTFFNPNGDASPYSEKRTRAGDIQALSSFCMGLSNSIDTGLGDKEKYILKAGSNMQGKISTFLQVSIKLDECLKIFKNAISVSRHSSLQVVSGGSGSVSSSDPVVIATADSPTELLDFEPLKRTIVSSLLNLSNVEICRVVHLAITYPSVKNTFATAVEEWNDIIKASQGSFSIGSLLGKAPVEATPFVVGVRRVVNLFEVVQKALQSPESSTTLSDQDWMTEWEYFTNLGKGSSSSDSTSEAPSTLGTPPFKVVVPESEQRLTALIGNSGLLLLFAHSLLLHTETKPLNHLTVVRIHVEDLLTNLVEESEALFSSIKKFRVDSGETLLEEVAWYRYVCDYADVCLVANEKKRIMEDFMTLDALCGGKGASAGEEVKELKSLFGKLKLQWFSSSGSNLAK